MRKTHKKKPKTVENLCMSEKKCNFVAVVYNLIRLTLKNSYVYAKYNSIFYNTRFKAIRV